MWSSGQAGPAGSTPPAATTPPAPTPPAAPPTGATQQANAQQQAQQFIHDKVAQINSAANDDAIKSVITEVKSRVAADQFSAALRLIDGAIDRGKRAAFRRVAAADFGVHVGGGGPRPGGAAGAQGANGQQQDPMAERSAADKEERTYSLNEQISGIQSQIQDLKGKLVEAEKNHEAQGPQLQAEREKIASQIQQLEYAREKLVDLQDRIAGKQSECNSLFARYAEDIANWTWLSKNDIVAEVQKAWDECVFAWIKAMNKMARAITGNGGEPIMPSAPSVRPFAPAQPLDTLLQQERAALNDLQGSEREQQTAINAQDAQDRAANEEVDRTEANQDLQYRNSREELQEQARRSEERLAELQKKLADVGNNAANGAAAAAGVA